MLSFRIRSSLVALLVHPPPPSPPPPVAVRSSCLCLCPRHGSPKPRPAHASTFSPAMDTYKAYFLYRDGDPSFHFTFMYHPPGRQRKQVNFNRKCEETVGDLLRRIKAKVEDAKKKKKKDEVAPCSLTLVAGNEPVSESSVCLEVMTADFDKEVSLRIDDAAYDVIVNSPWISDLNVPTTILAGFPVRPTKLEGFFFEKDHSVFKWFSESKPNVWTETGRSYVHWPSVDDVGKRIKLVCTPGDGVRTGPDFEVIGKNPVEAGPGSCPFEKRHAFTENRTVGEDFRVISYNILADIYCDSDFTRTTLFPYCPPYALKIEYRQLLIFKEILGYNADIVCLQEVDAKVFRDDLVPKLLDCDYDGIFTKKDGDVSEGLAIFFNSKRFEQMERHESVFSKKLCEYPIFEEIWEKVRHNEAFVRRISDRSNVVQAVLLRSKDTDRYLLIGNTHLYFHPDADHVRLVQGALIIYWLNDLLKTMRCKYGDKNVSLILCGDFNTVPSCGIYQLYTTGTVTDEIEDWKSNKEEALSNVTISQPTSLSSACGTPQYTNFTQGFADCLDYIFIENDKLEVKQVIPFPSEEELRAHTALPSVCFPSDHIALVADLRFKT